MVQGVLGVSKSLRDVRSLENELGGVRGVELAGESIDIFRILSLLPSHFPD